MAVPHHVLIGETSLYSPYCSILFNTPPFSLVPRPRPPREGKGVVTIAHFLVCAKSAVLFSRQPIRLLCLKISCDIKRPRTTDQFHNIIISHRECHMIVRYCYTVYLQLLNQHNQEFRPYSPDPLSRGAREGSGNETIFPYVLLVTY